MFTAVTLPLAGMIAAITYAWSTGHFGWFDATILLAGMWLTGIGITVGYHRMLTHRAFDCGPKTRAALMTLGAMSMQEGPLLWCAAHRKHHAFSDREGDPHSPHLHDGTLSGILAGLWHAHLGWLFTSEMMTADSQKYVPDLLADSFACWVQRYWEAVFVPLTLGLPAMLGAGWFAFTGQPISEGLFRGFIWGGLSRIFLIHHITWSVNSICHFWGRRDFAAKDESRNNFVCALVSSGEGWHNNHHAFPTSARLGLRWWQFDNGWQVIRLLEMAGLVWDVKLPSTDAMLRKELPHSS
jgi:stearoyl-CoA desaturase (delta-9 desaturase)